MKLVILTVLALCITVGVSLVHADHGSNNRERNGDRHYGWGNGGGSFLGGLVVGSALTGGIAAQQQPRVIVEQPYPVYDYYPSYSNPWYS